MSWYFKKDGVEKGPVTEDVLRSMIAEGELGPGVMAFCDGDGYDWRPLDKLEIFREELNIAAVEGGISSGAFMPNREITAKARRKLRGSWPIAVGAMAIYFGLEFSLDYMSCAGDLVSLLIGGALEVGLAIVVLNILHSSYASSLQIFGGFKVFLSAMLAYIMIGILILLGLLALVVPLFVVATGFGMTYFIMAEDPLKGPLEAMRESWAMMRGWKMKLFGLYCRFAGWYLLAVGPSAAGTVLARNYGHKWAYLLLVFWVGMLWIYPYLLMSSAIFYDSIKPRAMRTGGYAHAEQG